MSGGNGRRGDLLHSGIKREQPHCWYKLFGDRGDTPLISQPTHTAQLAWYCGSIPYCFYPLFAIAFAFIVAISGLDFGPMLRAEEKAKAQVTLSACARAMPCPVLTAWCFTLYGTDIVYGAT
eukprot:3422890-Rhodomonas_salina.3